MSVGGLKEGQPKYPGRNLITLKPKDKILVPHRVVIALQEWGWWVRQDNVWWKNGMPESVRDRTTTTHEYIFQLAKSESYYYDYEAVLEPAAYDGRKDTLFKGSIKYDENTIERVSGERWSNKLEGGIPARNKRSVWKVATKPYPGAHYAVYPPELIEPCILAGCPERVCEVCGKPLERVIEEHRKKIRPRKPEDHARNANASPQGGYRGSLEIKTTGWQETCDCNAGTKPGIVLDPFVGSGTTCWVAMGSQ